MILTSEKLSTLIDNLRRRLPKVDLDPDDIARILEEEILPKVKMLESYRSVTLSEMQSRSGTNFTHEDHG